MDQKPATKQYTIKPLRWSFKETECKQQWIAHAATEVFFVVRDRSSKKETWGLWNSFYNARDNKFFVGVPCLDAEGCKRVCQECHEASMKQDLTECEPVKPIDIESLIKPLEWRKQDSEHNDEDMAIIPFGTMRVFRPKNYDESWPWLACYCFNGDKKAEPVSSLEAGKSLLEAIWRERIKDTLAL